MNTSVLSLPPPQPRARLRTRGRGGIRARAGAVAAMAVLLVAGVSRAEGLQMRGLTFLAARGERAEVVVEAAAGRVDPDLERVWLQGVRVRLAEHDDTSGLEMTCDTGELDVGSRDFEARGNVHGSTADGRRFRAEWVRYDGGQRLLYTDAPVEITEGPLRLQGSGLRYQVASGRLQLLEAKLVHTP